MRQIKLFMAAALSVAATAEYSFAADGTVGTTSQADSTVSVTIPELILIGNLDNIALGTYSGTGNETDFTDFYVSGNDTTSPTYDVDIDSADCSGATYRLTDGSNFIAITVAFNDQAGTDTGAATIDCSDSPSANAQTGANTSLATTTDNARIRVTAAEAALQAVPPGTYSTTLTVIVTPEAG